MVIAYFSCGVNFIQYKKGNRLIDLTGYNI